MVCTLGNFATKLLRGDAGGHHARCTGGEEVRVLGPRAVRLYPLFHPAAALYTPANVEVLRADFARIPELVALGPPPQPEPEVEPQPQAEPVPVVEPGPVAPEPELEAPPAHVGPAPSLFASHDAPEGAPEPSGEPEREPVTGPPAGQLGLF